MNPILKYIIKVLSIVLLQVVVLHNLELGAANWWITPFVYFLIILDLPVKFNPLWSMLVGLALGFVIDVFYDTYGMHASAGVFIGFLRFYLLQVILPKDGFDTSSPPTLKNLGKFKYVAYVGIMSVAYHLWFFVLEAFSFQMFFLRLSQSIVSSLVAVILIVLYHLLFLKTSRR